VDTRPASHAQVTRRSAAAAALRVRAAPSVVAWRMGIT
jgi:hypothetical protein